MNLKLSPYILLLIVLFSCKQNTEKTGSEHELLANEIEDHLFEVIINKWYPLAVDSLHGGFLSNFNYKWDPVEPQEKMIVGQTRHTWTPSMMVLNYPDNELLKKTARHGFENLKNTMWDHEYGGFHNLLNRKGALDLQSDYAGQKRAYGNSFGIYATATYAEMSEDTAALNLAKKAFMWMEEHAHDAENGGYFEHLTREGEPILKPTDERVSGYNTMGFKDYNSSIHILEAFTALYNVWQDDLVKERLEEMFYIIRDTMVHRDGYLKLYFYPDWTHLSFKDSTREVREQHYHLDHVTFGHDVETAFLLLEASHALGFENDTTTLMLGKKMVDHALQNGWDQDLGGFHYEGVYENGEMKIITPFKSWWVTAEGLNALLLMHQYFPGETKYFEAFLKLWEYTKTYQADMEHGGWYARGLDISPDSKDGLKGQSWKTSYHNARALMNCVNMLRSDGPSLEH